MAKSRRERGDGLLEAIVLKRRNPTAAIADHVVMVVASRQRRFVASTPGANLNPLHDANLVQELERAVDAGKRGRALVPLAKAVPDLLSGQTASLAREQLDHRITSAPAPSALLTQRRLGVLNPGLGRLPIV